MEYGLKGDVDIMNNNEKKYRIGEIGLHNLEKLLGCANLAEEINIKINEGQLREKCKSDEEYKGSFSDKNSIRATIEYESKIIDDLIKKLLIISESL